MSLRALNSETADLCLQWSHILNSIESMTQSNPLDILSHLREVALPLHRTIPALITNSSLDETQKDALHKLHHTTKMIFNRCIARLGGANSDAIIDACAYGDTESVIAFVQAGKSLSRQELGLAIINASFAGHIDTVAPLVQGDWMISNGDLGQAVMNASLSGQVLFLEFLLSGQRPISEGCLGMAVRYAASQGQQEVIRLLLSSGRQVSIDDFVF